MWRSGSATSVDSSSDGTDTTEFVTRAADKSGPTLCYVDRVSVQKGIYRMYTSKPPVRLILTAQRIKSSGSEYIIYTTHNGVQRDVGRLKSNVIGTAFTLYETTMDEEEVLGTGDNTPTTAPSTPTMSQSSSINSLGTMSIAAYNDITPPMSPATNSRIGRDSDMVSPLAALNEASGLQSPRDTSTSSLRSMTHLEVERARPRSSISKRGKNELVGIRYESNVFGLKGPRRMTIVLPGMGEDEKPLPWSVEDKHKDDKKPHLVESSKEGDTDFLRVLRNKPPQWNDAMMSYTLDFGGRVTVPSVKNFQLIHNLDANYIVMQMGKCRPRQEYGNPYFNVDYQYPMSALQAFGIALSSFDSKLACE